MCYVTVLTSVPEQVLAAGGDAQTQHTNFNSLVDDELLGSGYQSASGVGNDAQQCLCALVSRIQRALCCAQAPCDVSGVLCVVVVCVAALVVNCARFCALVQWN